MSGEIYPLCTSGRRLEWNYVIKYHGGDTQSFIKPCISLPFENMSRNAVAQRVAAIVRQVVLSDAVACLAAAKKNIIKVLRVRQEERFIDSWESFFSSIPTDNNTAHTSYENSLSNLSITYGGFIHKKTVRHVTYKT